VVVVVFPCVGVASAGITRNACTALGQGLVGVFCDLLPSLTHALTDTEFGAAITTALSCRGTKRECLDGVLVLAQEELGEGAHNLLGGRREGEVRFSTSSHDCICQTLGDPVKQASLSSHGSQDDFNREQGHHRKHVEHVVHSCTREGSLQLQPIS